ncbi:MAG TPA: phenylalanine--tRNA ligase subunit alpha [Acidimicrobiia bacterium]
MSGDAGSLAARAVELGHKGAAAAAAAGTLEDLDEIDRRFLGKRSELLEVREAIKSAAPEDRKDIGRALGEAQAAIKAAIDDRRVALAAEGVGAASGPALDLTLGGRGYERGHLHLVTQVWRELEDIFVGLGYRVFGGPEVEDDWHNFQALNFPVGHPARAMQDTLYVKLGAREQVMLRTHTSPVQIRLMETLPLPIYAVMPGRTFRRDTPDARHSPVFHQIEALVIDRGITMGDLMGTIETFIHALFGDDVRTRFLPSFFPFTEPSAELSFSCPFCTGGCRVCSHTGWIELGGCGVVDPNVLVAGGVDPEEYSGFAFGFGIDRIALMRNEIDNIQSLLWENDVRFLRQF